MGKRIFKKDLKTGLLDLGIRLKSIKSLGNGLRYKRILWKQNERSNEMRLQIAKSFGDG